MVLEKAKKPKIKWGMKGLLLDKINFIYRD